MSFILRPWQLFFLILSGLVNRKQQEIIDFHNAQIRALMDKMGRRRILLTDDQRRVLAAKGKALGRRTLMELTTIVTPDTILRWHRRLIAAKWDSIAAVDFTTVEVWARSGLTTFYVLVAMRLNTRRVEIAGITECPDGDWVGQMARNLTASGGFLDGASHLLIDRDTKFLPLRTYLNDMTDTDIVLLPPRSPNLNAFAERFVRSIKSECLERMVLIGEGSLRRAVDQFCEHYHCERNHQGLGNKIIEPDFGSGGEGEVQCRERLGGLLRYYYRDTA